MIIKRSWMAGCIIMKRANTLYMMKMATLFPNIIEYLIIYIKKGSDPAPLIFYNNVS